MTNTATTKPMPETPAPAKLGRNVWALSAVSLFTDVSSEMIYPLLPLFLTSVLGVGAGFIGAIEGAAESTAAFLKLASGWWSDRVSRRKPLVVLGYGIAALARPLVAIAQSATQVLLIRVSDRVGKGIRNSPRDALIAESVHPGIRGRAFGVHRAADHFGAVVGPLIAFALIRWRDMPLRTLFFFAAIPGIIGVIVLIAFVRDIPRERRDGTSGPQLRGGLPRRFWAVLGVILLFTLGNSTDAFLLLRARELGVPVALAPILWAWLHVVKSVSSTPGGSLSDRIGRKPVLVAGWLVYAASYLAFGYATAMWQAWAIFGVYGLYFGLTEGAERALVSDLVPAHRRGSAFGWFYLAVGLGAFPASVWFGLVWDRFGSSTAFIIGAALAAAAAVALTVVPLGQQQREPGRS